MKKLLLSAVTALTLAAGTSGASAYTGDWYYHDNVRGRELMKLGDNTDGTYLLLRGTARYCGSPGNSYAQVQRVLRRNGQTGQQIDWWITDSCNDGYVRICVENRRGENACSTYIDDGWWDW